MRVEVVLLAALQSAVAFHALPFRGSPRLPDAIAPAAARCRRVNVITAQLDGDASGGDPVGDGGVQLPEDAPRIPDTDAPASSSTGEIDYDPDWYDSPETQELLIRMTEPFALRGPQAVAAVSLAAISTLQNNYTEEAAEPQLEAAATAAVDAMKAKRGPAAAAAAGAAAARAVAEGRSTTVAAEAGAEAASLMVTQMEEEGIADDEQMGFSAPSHEENNESDAQGRLVGMDMPLDLRAESLKPVRGPPIPSPEDMNLDPRPLYLYFAKYREGLMPSESLEADYVAWLRGYTAPEEAWGDEEGEGPRIESGGQDAELSKRLAFAQYMLANSSFDDEMYKVGEALSDEELAAREAQDAAGASAVAEEEEETSPSMIPTSMQFVIGNVNLVHAQSLDEARAWAQLDPHHAALGYESSEVLRWIHNMEPELNVPVTQGECYIVMCRDAPASDARAPTREVHLGWLRESHRVLLAGPLLGADDSAVGTLLVVHGNGDELEDVREWALKDPYALEGLFEEVFVAPIAAYGDIGQLCDTLPDN